MIGGNGASFNQGKVFKGGDLLSLGSRIKQKAGAMKTDNTTSAPPCHKAGTNVMVVLHTLRQLVPRWAFATGQGSVVMLLRTNVFCFSR